MSSMNDSRIFNRRILLVDDMAAIHDDFRKILVRGGSTSELDDAEAMLFGSNGQAAFAGFEVDSAYQGQEGMKKLEQALKEDRPYAMAFVDMRMPPGWDGVETIEHLWQLDPRLQVVICTAYSDYSWEEVLGRLEVRDRLLVLKKPFDLIEVRQLANALTTKWAMTQQAALKMDALEQAVQQRTQELTSEMKVRKRAQAALENANKNLLESEERYRLLVELSPDAILIEREGRIVFANRTAQDLFRAAKIDDLLNLPVTTLLSKELAAKHAKSEQIVEQGDDPALTTEEMALCRDGSQVPVVVTRLIFMYEEKPAVQMVVRDVSEYQRAKEKLQHQANHDTLTGLPNRHLFMDRLHQAITYALRNEGRLAVCFIDLDRFKWINDNLGHAAGDELLKTVASRIGAAVRDTDTIARIGGDEFVLLLCNQGGTVRDFETVVKRIVSSVAEPMTLGGRQINVSCSVGCSNFPEDSTDSSELLKFADAAMYRAKQMGRNNMQIYNEDLHRHINEYQKLENDLRVAIEKNQLALFYQPQVDIRTGAITCVEVLLRWMHPELGNISTARFITVAEESGLIESIGAWVIEKTCEQSKAWEQAGLPEVCFAINISPKQIEWSGLEAHIKECLTANKVDPGCIEFEFAEHVVMQSLEQNIVLMKSLKRLGVKLAIDNFGTGYSNLRALAKLPIDKLKLDGSFVKDIINNPDHLAIANTIITMGHQLGLKIVAEAVETEGQVALLTHGGCDQAQGYLFAPALPQADLALLLQKGKVFVPEQRQSDRRTRTLLVLDDDPGITQALKRALKFDGYSVLLANRSDEAFELLACNDVGVVLCDQRLQDTTGLEMLFKIKRLYPQIVRLLFSQYQEFETMTEAINRAAVFKYLGKPFSNHELREILNEAFEEYEKSLSDVKN